MSFKTCFLKSLQILHPCRSEKASLKNKLIKTRNLLKIKSKRTIQRFLALAWQACLLDTQRRCILLILNDASNITKLEKKKNINLNAKKNLPEKKKIK